MLGVVCFDRLRCGGGPITPGIWQLARLREDRSVYQRIYLAISGGSRDGGLVGVAVQVLELGRMRLQRAETTEDNQQSSSSSSSSTTRKTKTRAA